MKNLFTFNQFKMIIYSFLIWIPFMFSCQSESVASQDSLNAIVAQLIVKAENEKSAINAIIKKSGEHYSLELLENVDNFTLALYLEMKTNYPNKENQMTDVVVTCVDSGEFTVCSGNGGMGQLRCIAKAVQLCFEKGECAEVCNQEILIIPPGLR